MPTIFDRYFTLSDAAVTDEASFYSLICLFGPDAVVSADGAGDVRGTTDITTFFRSLLGRNRIIRHVWVNEPSENAGAAASWGVVGVRKDGEIFSARGLDLAEVNGSGRICRLDIRRSSAARL